MSNAMHMPEEIEILTNQNYHSLPLMQTLAIRCIIDNEFVQQTSVSGTLT